MSVHTDRKRVDQTVSTVPDCVKVDVVYVMGGGAAVSVDCGTCVVGGPASVFRSGIDGYADFAGEVAVGVAPPAVLAAAVAVGMASPAVAGAASLGDLAGEVAVVEDSPAVAGAASLVGLAGVSLSK